MLCFHLSHSSHSVTHCNCFDKTYLSVPLQTFARACALRYAHDRFVHMTENKISIGNDRSEPTPANPFSRRVVVVVVVGTLIKVSKLLIYRG